MRILFIARIVPSLGATRRARFEQRKQRDGTSSISNADRVKVFDQLVTFASTNPGCTLDDVFEQRIARNRHLMNLTQVLQRIMRACTQEAFFAERVLELRAARQRAGDVDHHAGAGESADDTRDEIEGQGLEVGDSDDTTVALTCRELLRREKYPANVITALETLYGQLSKFSIGLQAQITGLDYEPRLLSLYSVARDTDQGQVWDDCTTVEEARHAYHTAQARRAEAQSKQKDLTMKALGNCFG